MSLSLHKNIKSMQGFIETNEALRNAINDRVAETNSYINQRKNE